jgi:hypothetical protein
MPDPRFAPAREDGTKPYVVKVKCARPMHCNHIAERLVYAWTPTSARSDALKRELHTKAILKEYR